VLTTNYLCTYKEERVYSSPTETINMDKIKIVKSDDKSNSNIFVNC
jgi:hypothetical protein